MADTTSMDAVLKLMQSLSGKGNTGTQNTSGGTKTEQTQLDQTTLNSTLKSALESNQGLAQLAAGQNNTGMYNSTTNQQLTNDLLARLTTDTAEKSAPKVTTTTGGTTTSSTKGPGIMDQLGPVVALSVGKKGIDKLMSGDMNSWFSGGSDSAVGAGQTAVNDFVNTNTLSGVETASNVGSFLSDAGSSLAESFGSSALDTAVGSGFDSALWGMGSSAVADTAASSAGEAAATNTLGTVICTEAARQGAISHWYLENELAHLQQHPLNVYIKSGYHVLATPVVRWMQRSQKATQFFATWAVSYIQGDTQDKSDWKHKFIRYVLFPICWVVGVVVGKEE